MTHHGRTAKASVRPAYQKQFYVAETRPSGESARRVVPALAEVFRPTSVVDVGCGAGLWLAAFREEGVTDVLGLDTGDVPSELLAIPPGQFRLVDLEQPIVVDRRFDLVLCLEVAEHLSESVARQLVSSLVSLGDVVVFSAAVPGQGGEHHVNEQWQSYWAGIFAEHDYVPVDIMRSRFWDDRSVEAYYLQNCLVYVPASAPAIPGTIALNQASVLDVVHPRLFLGKGAESMSLRPLLKTVTTVGRRAVRRRLRRG